MKSILLIGAGRFGRHVAMKLNELGHHVMAVDNKEDMINAVLPYVTSAQIGDCTKREFLKTLGVNNFDVCIVAIGDNFQSSLETTSLLKEMKAKYVVSRASRGVHAKFLLKNGADEIVYPEKQVAEWTAIRYSSDHIFDYIKLADGYSIFEVEIPKYWDGKSIVELDIRNKFNITLMAIRRNDKLNLELTASTVLKEDDRVLVLGSDKAIARCFKL